MRARTGPCTSPLPIRGRQAGVPNIWGCVNRYSGEEQMIQEGKMSSTLGLVVVEAGGSRGGGGGVVPRRDFRLFHLLPQLSSRYLPSTHISPLRLLSPPCFRPSSSAAPPSPNSGLPLRSHRRDQRATSHPRLVGVYIITTWSERIEQQGPHPRRLIVLPFGCVAKKKKKKSVPARFPEAAVKSE